MKKILIYLVMGIVLSSFVFAITNKTWQQGCAVTNCDYPQDWQEDSIDIIAESVYGAELGNYSYLMAEKSGSNNVYARVKISNLNETLIGLQIYECILNLTVGSSSGTAANTSIQRLSTNWTEGIYNDTYYNDTSINKTLIQAADTNTYFNITSYCQDISKGSTDHGFAINITDSPQSADDYVLFRSADASGVNAINRPILYVSLKEIGETVTYVNRTLETEEQEFVLKLNFLDSVIANKINTTLYYNGTGYDMTRTNFTDTTATFNLTIDIPYLNDGINATNISFYYHYNYSTNTQSGFSINSSIYNHEVYKIKITNCSLEESITTLNITLIDEITLEAVTDELEVNFEVWYKNSNLLRNYSFGSYGASNHSFCIEPIWANYTADAVFTYTAPEYETRNYYLSSALFNNITSNLVLPLLSDTNATKITFYVLEQLGNRPVTNAILKAQRYYPDTNVYKTVEVGKTDSSGIVALQLTLDSALYRFVVEKGNVVLKTTDKNKITMTTIYLYISEEDVFFQDYDDFTGISHSLDFDNNTNTFTFSFSDNSGFAQEGCMVITKRTAKGETLVSEQCTASTSATLEYEIGTVGNYFARSYVIGDSGVKYILNTVEFINYEATDIFGTYGTYLYLMFLGTIIFTGIFNPIPPIIMGLLGIGAGIGLGFINTGYIFLTLMSIVGAILIYKLKA